MVLRLDVGDALRLGGIDRRGRQLHFVVGVGRRTIKRSASRQLPPVGVEPLESPDEPIHIVLGDALSGSLRVLDQGPLQALQRLRVDLGPRSAGDARSPTPRPDAVPLLGGDVVGQHGDDLVLHQVERPDSTDRRRARPERAGRCPRTDPTRRSRSPAASGNRHRSVLAPVRMSPGGCWERAAARSRASLQWTDRPAWPGFYHSCRPLSTCSSHFTGPFGRRTSR